MDGEVFHIDKQLSNPKFDGYKLHIIPQEDAVVQFPLTNKPTQAAISGKVPLAFQEVRSRITHNHLAVHSESGRAIYVDTDYNVILIEFNQGILEPSTRIIYELPKPLTSNAVDSRINRQYPSAIFFSATSLLVSDGLGVMYVLRLGETRETATTLVGEYVLPSTDTGDASTSSPPFLIHHVHRPSPLCVIATLSSRHYPSEPTQKTSKPLKHTPVEFDIRGVKVNFMDAQAVDQHTPLEVLWHRRGEDVPFFTTYDEENGLHALIGGSEFHKLDVPPLSAYEPNPDEIAPIPRAEENLATSNTPAKPPPYSWTQSSDSVTIAIPLPSTMPKDKIKVIFSPTTLTVHVDLDSNITLPEGITLPRYSAKKLWGGISSSSSFWTFDREAERTFGVLSLHLEKQHEDTRWSHIFATSGTDSQADEDVDVPETLDPSELWNIREALEKYTAALQGEDTTGLGLGRGVPSLAENEVDEEVDSSVGRNAYLTWVADPSLPNEPEFLSKKKYTSPFQILSTPIPGQEFDKLVSLIIRHDINGNVFELEKSQFEDAKLPNWKHTATYPALAFVLASKQDTRFTYHIPNKAVFAFESGASNRGGNVYIYYPTSAKATTAKQAILKLNDGRGGALLGVGSFTDSNGRHILVCLTERELTIIKGI